jgi:hypothetical protein
VDNVKGFILQLSKEQSTSEDDEHGKTCCNTDDLNCIKKFVEAARFVPLWGKVSRAYRRKKSEEKIEITNNLQL